MVFTTAELGTAWEGDFGILRNLVQECKEAGFDAVKLQAFKREHLTKAFDRLVCSVNEYNIDKISEIINGVGIKWYCTPCYPEAVDFLAPFIDTWKIRYKDRKNKQILKKVLAYQQPTYISCSDDSLPIMKEHDNFIPLYCIPRYPHRVHEINWENMKTLKGWSVHCPSFHAIESAIYIGVDKFEIHVVPKHDELAYADDHVSFSVDEFPKLFEVIKDAIYARNNTASTTNLRKVSE